MTILYNDQTKHLSKFYENGYNLPIREPYMHELEVIDVKPTIIENQWLTSEWTVDLEKKQYVKVYTVHTKTAYDLACEAWGQMHFKHKVIAPVELQFEYPEVITYAIINPDLMLIEKKLDGLHVYYNKLHEYHLPLVQSIGLVELDRPKP